MNAIYSDKAKQSKEIFALMQQATQILEGVLEQSADHVKAEWDCNKDDKGRFLSHLAISDWTGSADTVFTPEELASATRMRVLLYRLWGKLLQSRFDKQLQKLSETGQ